METPPGQGAANQLARKVAEDNVHWAQALKLEGAWPAEWVRGLSYDLTTVFANIRPAVGVFQHPWE